jgi:PEP-CTERM motif
MTVKMLTCFALLCAIVAQGAQAQPTLSVYPIGVNGGNREWFVDITPDPALFVNSGPMGVPPNTIGGALGVEIGFSIDAPVSLVTAMIDNISLWPAELFGNSPFPFGGPPADGLTIQGNQLFVAQGSDFLTATSSKHFLKIQTAGSGPTTIRWLGAYDGKGLIGQSGNSYYVIGSASVPEPASAALVIFGMSTIAIIGRRRFAQ